MEIGPFLHHIAPLAHLSVKKALGFFVCRLAAVLNISNASGLHKKRVCHVERYLRKACFHVNLTMESMSLRLLLPPNGPPALLPRARGSSSGGMGVPTGLILGEPFSPLRSVWPDDRPDAWPNAWPDNWPVGAAEDVLSCSPHRDMTGAVAPCPARSVPDRAAALCCEGASSYSSSAKAMPTCPRWRRPPRGTRAAPAWPVVARPAPF